MIHRLKRKPLVYEAIQWPCDETELAEFMEGGYYKMIGKEPAIETGTGLNLIHPGSWIVRDGNGSWWPLEDVAMKASYETTTDDPSCDDVYKPYPEDDGTLSLEEAALRYGGQTGHFPVIDQIDRESRGLPPIDPVMRDEQTGMPIKDAKELGCHGIGIDKRTDDDETEAKIRQLTVELEAIGVDNAESAIRAAIAGTIPPFSNIFHATDELLKSGDDELREFVDPRTDEEKNHEHVMYCGKYGLGVPGNSAENPGSVLNCRCSPAAEISKSAERTADIINRRRSILRDRGQAITSVVESLRVVVSSVRQAFSIAREFEQTLKDLEDDGK